MSSDMRLSRLGELIFCQLVERGSSGRGELLERLELDEETLADELERLHRLRLVEYDGQYVVPLPPRLTLEAIAAASARDAIAARETVDRLTGLWAKHTSEWRYVDFLSTDAAVAAAERSILEDAHAQVRSLSIGPVGPPVDRPAPEIMPGFDECVGRGAVVRAVYGAAVLGDPVGLRLVQQCISQGEQARVFPDVPLNMTIADDHRALVIVPGSARERRHAMIVHSSGLLDALIRMFESYWRMGVPVSLGTSRGTGEGTDVLDDETCQLLAYLTAGLTDESIARELGVSERTVGRRVAKLHELLGAVSRFQLGVQAARRGWI